MPADRSPSLRTVADRAGVSASTVSNVVHGYEHVSAETRQAVQQVIEELGYRPNLAARHLRGRRTGLLGLVVPELASPYFAELAALITREAAGRGWTVLVDETTGEPERERALLGRTATNVVDGLIVSPWSLPPDDVAAAAGGKPVVVLGERSAVTADHVAIDSVAAARDATAHLIARGRTRLAAIGLQPHLSNGTAAQRTRGFRLALKGREPVAEIATATLHRSDGAAAVASLLDSGTDVDGLVCFTDELALGAIRELADHGVVVPDDVSVVGVDDIEDGRFSVPRLTTVAPDKQSIAQVAVAGLVDRIAHDTGRRATYTVVPHRLVVRQSS